jgi:hypothetical protein
MNITLPTKLLGNFRLLVVEERFEARTQERYLVDDSGQVFKAVPPTEEKADNGNL